MPKIKVYNLDGKVVQEDDIDAKFFNIKIKPEVVQQVVETQLANKRQVLAHAKGRSEVRGGGKKPWRQKGTGRARHGSIRSPLWKGGGVTFGPTKERNFSKSINQKVKSKALHMVLVDKINFDHVILVDEFKLNSVKTKDLAAVLKKLPLKNKSTLIALDKKNEDVVRCAKNLVKVQTLPAISLNVLDILKSEYLLMPRAALKNIVSKYL